MFKLGLSSFSFSWKIKHDPAWTPRELLEVAKREKVPVLQFGDNMPLAALRDDELYLLAHEAEEAGIAIEVGMRGLFAEEVRRYLEICRLVKANFLRLVIDQGGFEPAEAEVVELLREVAPNLEAHGVMMGIENHDRFRSRTLTRIIETVESPWLGICLDTANSIGAGEGMEETVRTLAPYTVNVHLKDFTIRRIPSQLGLAVEGAVAGTGRLDIPWILKQIPRKEISVVLEQWPPQQPDMEKTLELEERWVGESVQNLKKILAAQ